MLENVRSVKTSRTEFAITASVLADIRRTVGCLPAESGGALGGIRVEGVVRQFVFDRTAKRTGVTYSPDHVFLNKLFDEEWNPAGINLLGFVHSHPSGSRRPSLGDLEYAKQILAGIPKLDRLYLPIVMTEPDTGNFELLPFAAKRRGHEVQLEALTLKIIDDTTALAPRAEARQTDSGDETFDRVREAYDLPRLKRCRVIYVGAGGAAAFVEDLARAGVGQHVLIDPDTVSATNLATQQVYRRDLGRPKVECLAERILDINPQASVAPHAFRLDNFNDDELSVLLRGPLDQGDVPVVSLLCGLTDNFQAQARINRLALKFGVPSLCAQVYREGRGAEITFTYPGVTPACHRCVLSSRYAAYLDDEYQNAVTSDGTPIFATARLNATKGFLALAILHHSSDHPRWGGLLRRIAERNLIQIRMDPDFSSSLGLSVFDTVFSNADRSRLIFDETVWLPQKPDNPNRNGQPNCPDCGGHGDLSAAIGVCVDTRPMPPTSNHVHKRSEAGNAAIDALCHLVVVLMVMSILVSMASQVFSALLVILLPIVTVVGLLIGTGALLGGAAAYRQRWSVPPSIEYLPPQGPLQLPFTLEPLERPRDVRGDYGRRRS